MRDRDTVVVPPEKRELAREILRRIDSDPETFTVPTDLPEIDEWRPEPTHKEWLGEEDSDKTYRRVNPAKVVGTDPMNTDRLCLGRLVKALDLLCAEKYDKEPRWPPALHHYREQDVYFVGADGNHRALAFKLLDLPEMYAEVEPYRAKQDMNVGGQDR